MSSKEITVLSILVGLVGVLNVVLGIIILVQKRSGMFSNYIFGSISHFVLGLAIIGLVIFVLIRRKII